MITKMDNKMEDKLVYFIVYLNKDMIGTIHIPDNEYINGIRHVQKTMNKDCYLGVISFDTLYDLTMFVNQ